MIKKLFILSFFISSIHYSGLAQDVKASAKLDSNKILIGDQVKMKLQLSFPSKTLVVWPELNDSLSGKIEIIQKSKIDTVKGTNNLTLNQVYTLSAYDSGSFYIPQISFKYKNTGDTGFATILTDSILLNVNTIAVDTTKAIKDIKGPLDVPFNWKALIPYVAGGIALVAIIVLLIYYFQKKKKGGKFFIDFSKPPLPAHEIALLALEELKNKKLWQNNKVKEYYTELSDIIRIYIEKRFSVNAMEMTSDEIISTFRSIDIANDLKDKLRQLFILSDLVKFAKANPLPNEHDLNFLNAQSFVKDTIPVFIPAIAEEMKNKEAENNFPVNEKKEDKSNA
ncbi:MAG TPA: hypothetical protein PKK00_05635 [Bacteroidales bacterium]|nr:hypothetical protein [Bacteroidales bacterium]HPS16355.1 hypothetical protein [Bacteroidales bacterium]